MGGILFKSKVLSTKLTFGTNPMSQIWLGYIRTFDDYLNEPDSAGIEPLVDYPNYPDLAGVYSRNSS